MEREDYEYTLNFIQVLSDELEAAANGWEYLNSLPEGHPDKFALSPEMEAAHKSLAIACEEFVKAYTRHL